MATYIAVINFTEQGIRSVKESPTRLGAAAKLAESMGVRVKQAFWTFGQYDMVVISEGSDEAVAAWMYKVGSMGNIRSTTLRAFTADEMQQIVAKIP
ncbi:MAG TPA: GYD domain-containing protein [Casimicrobiaceae bacterium]|nr:GYD domain-containing protein [Casimicrobiaceae bacterium]